MDEGRTDLGTIHRAPLRVAGPLGAALALGGLTVVGRGMTKLQWAHRYRQQSSEGIGFFEAGLYLLLGGLTATLGATALYLTGRHADPRQRKLLVGAAALVVSVLVACAVVALWVEGHGERCVGQCG